MEEIRDADCEAEEYADHSGPAVNLSVFQHPPAKHPLLELGHSSNPQINPICLFAIVSQGSIDAMSLSDM
jgi:hypothetical protein